MTFSIVWMTGPPFAISILSEHYRLNPVVDDHHETVLRKIRINGDFDLVISSNRLQTYGQYIVQLLGRKSPFLLSTL